MSVKGKDVKLKMCHIALLVKRKLTGNYIFIRGRTWFLPSSEKPNFA
jgi:hypothetical protein